LIHLGPCKATPRQNRPVLKIFDQSFDCRDFSIAKTIGETVTRLPDNLESIENLPAIEQMNVQNRSSGDFARQLLVTLIDVSLG